MLLLLLLGACQKLNRFIHVMSCSKNSHLSLFIYFFPTFTQKLYNLLNPGPELSMLEIKILLTEGRFLHHGGPGCAAVHSNHGQHAHIVIDGWMLTENTRNCLIAARYPARAHTTYLGPH